MNKNRYIAVDASCPEDEISNRYFTAYSHQLGESQALNWIRHSAKSASRLTSYKGEQIYPYGVSIWLQTERGNSLIETFSRN